MPTRLITLLAVALLVLAGAAAVDAGSTGAGQQVSIQEESFTPGSGGIVELNHSDRGDAVYAERVEVRDENGTLMDSPDDYRWVSKNGTLNVTSSGDLAGDASGTINYSYSLPTETQSDVVALFASQFEVAQLLIFVLGVAVLLGGVRVLGGV